ncbi:MAG: glycosyltransferase [Sedimenticola sp.]
MTGSRPQSHVDTNLPNGSKYPVADRVDECEEELTDPQFWRCPKEYVHMLGENSKAVVNSYSSPSSTPSTPRVSVVVRCYNEEKHIGRLLEGILRQTLHDVEVVIVDSGSLDATLAIASRYPTKCVTLPKDDFSFGRSLNLGCSTATGDIIVAISAHCYPIYSDWLERLVDPLTDPNVAMAYGKQRGNGFSKFSERQIYCQWFGEESDFAQRHPFANNANSAFRRDVWEKQPFDETLTGLEDLDWTHKTMRNGYRVAYVAEAEVAHIHEETWEQIYNRYRREAIAMRRILPQERFTLLDFVRLSWAGIFGDMRVARHEGTLRQELSSIVLYRLLQYLGTYHGYRQRDLISQDLRETFYYPGGRRSSKGVKSSFSRKSAPISYLGAQPNILAVGTLEGRKFYDISLTISKAPVWPGDSKPEVVQVKSLNAGDQATVSNLLMCVHTGTHVDAPAHFVRGGAVMSEISLSRFIGKVQVVDLHAARVIGPRELDQVEIPPDCQRLLLKTRNAVLLEEEKFSKDYAALTPDGAKWIQEHNISLIGIDYLSIEAFGEKDNLTHKILLEADVVVLEGLDLRGITSGCYELICLPLKIGESEAAPARVILLEEEHTA